MGIGLCLILNFVAIVIGRFIFGFCNGIYFVAGPKMLDETIPITHLGTYGTATNTFLSLGLSLAMILGLILPDDGDTVGQAADGNWRIVYGFPLFCQFLSATSLLLYFRQDSITNNISN